MTTDKDAGSQLPFSDQLRLVRADSQKRDGSSNAQPKQEIKPHRIPTAAEEALLERWSQAPALLERIGAKDKLQIYLRDAWKGRGAVYPIKRLLHYGGGQVPVITGYELGGIGEQTVFKTEERVEGQTRETNDKGSWSRSYGGRTWQEVIASWNCVRHDVIRVTTSRVDPDNWDQGFKLSALSHSDIQKPIEQFKYIDTSGLFGRKFEVSRELRAEENEADLEEFLLIDFQRRLALGFMPSYFAEGDRLGMLSLTLMSRIHPHNKASNYLIEELF